MTGPRVLIDNLQQEAHVWFTIPESVRDHRTIQRLEALLSAEEIDRYRRFYFAEDRHRYLISHALVRETLSKYIDLPPVDWCFSFGDHGRPEIANPGTPAVRFNLTHTRGLAACVITLAHDCGIDAEKIRKRSNPVGVARRMFSDAENRSLQRLQGRAFMEHFFSAWTLREAYVKAIGVGIAFPTHKLTFAVEADDSVAISFHPHIDDRPEDWDFRLLRPTGEHIAATAVRRRDGVETRIITHFADL
jgi:4'-phosphopantetheinyl transferase